MYIISLPTPSPKKIRKKKKHFLGGFESYWKIIAGMMESRLTFQCVFCRVQSYSPTKAVMAGCSLQAGTGFQRGHNNARKHTRLFYLKGPHICGHMWPWCSMYGCNQQPCRFLRGALLSRHQQERPSQVSRLSCSGNPKGSKTEMLSPSHPTGPQTSDKKRILSPGTVPVAWRDG